MEISICISGLNFDGLSGGNHGFDLRGTVCIVASIQLVKEVVLVLRDGDGLEDAGCSNTSSTFSVDLWQVNRGNRLYSVEVVVVQNGNVGVIKASAHHVLGVVLSPWVAMQACRVISWVELVVAVAGFLLLV